MDKALEKKRGSHPFRRFNVDEIAERRRICAMPIPDLDNHGLLPVGVHDCSLGELQSRFGSFQESDRRPKLFAKLKALLAEAEKGAFAITVLVDGSFVTAVPDPNDIDLVLVLPLDFDVVSDLPPAQYNLVSRKRVKRSSGLICLWCVKTRKNMKRPLTSSAECVIGLT
jgi:hypothetical protein